MDIVKHKGGKVSYHDPYIPTVKTNEGHVFNSIELNREEIMKADCVVLTTNHKVTNLKLIIEISMMIVDLRNMIDEESNKVIKL